MIETLLYAEVGCLEFRTWSLDILLPAQVMLGKDIKVMSLLFSHLHTEDGAEFPI